MKILNLICFLILLFWPLSASTGEIETSFYRIHGDSRERGNEITEIGIERTGCYGTCPQYSFIVRGVQGNGGFDYEGYAYTKRLGKYSGTVDLDVLKGVVQAVQNLGFMNMNDEYSSNFTDRASVFTMVIKGGKAKIIKDYGHKGPERLLELEKLIDGLMLTAKWNKVKEKIVDNHFYYH